jgi:hypothetical protein
LYWPAASVTDSTFEPCPLRVCGVGASVGVAAVLGAAVEEVVDDVEVSPPG